MHGSSFNGDTTRALAGLADDDEERLRRAG
jgi:hypothetical protein